MRHEDQEAVIQAFKLKASRPHDDIRKPRLDSLDIDYSHVEATEFTHYYQHARVADKLQETGAGPRYHPNQLRLPRNFNRVKAESSAQYRPPYNKPAPKGDYHSKLVKCPRNLVEWAIKRNLRDAENAGMDVYGQNLTTCLQQIGEDYLESAKLDRPVFGCNPKEVWRWLKFNKINSDNDSEDDDDEAVLGWDEMSNSKKWAAIGQDYFAQASGYVDFRASYDPVEIEQLEMLAEKDEDFVICDSSDSDDSTDAESDEDSVEEVAPPKPKKVSVRESLWKYRPAERRELVKVNRAKQLSNSLARSRAIDAFLTAQRRVARGGQQSDSESEYSDDHFIDCSEDSCNEDSHTSDSNPHLVDNDSEHESDL
ncbi:hypothetical protein BT63DRAFT_429808 [Microthyrium microscopicum]|uniref:Uncharacterized protein n=1 Tax=Microthyrium microscopicum TaxID=703497 RepID=A0A6A6TYR9_9PEZI|nr:hypothetical protein BT63DRAFT_429808 [Microthyrium microscopicum]